MGIHIAGDFDVDLLATREDVQRLHKALVESKPRGKYYVISGATTNTAAQPGPIAISFTPQSPPAGRLWLVEWIAVWQANTQAGLLAGAIANLFAAVCVGNCPVGPGGPNARAVNINANDIVVPANAIPGAISVPDKTVVKSQLQLYILIGGSGLTSTNFNCTAGVVDVPDDDEVYFW